MTTLTDARTHLTARLALHPGRLHVAKHAYATRHVDRSAATGLDRRAVPRAGDLVLATSCPSASTSGSS